MSGIQWTRGFTRVLLCGKIKSAVKINIKKNEAPDTSKSEQPFGSFGKHYAGPRRNTYFFKESLQIAFPANPKHAVPTHPAKTPEKAFKHQRTWSPPGIMRESFFLLWFLQPDFLTKTGLGTCRTRQMGSGMSMPKGLGGAPALCFWDFFQKASPQTHFVWKSLCEIMQEVWIQEPL